MRLRHYVAMLGIAIGVGLALAPGAQAAVVVNISVPVGTPDLLVVNFCNGHEIDLTGDLHILVSSTINGNQVSGKTQFQPQGVSGTDQTTGAEYQGTGVTMEDFNASLVNSQAVVTQVNNFRLIGQGSAVNLLIHENFHLTFNADGTVTAALDNSSLTCR